MKKTVLWICILVGVLGVIAFVLGIAAEAKHNKADEVRMDESGRCIYPRSPAFVMGVIAALALMMAQILINVAAGCLCCGRHVHYQAPLNTTIAIICLVLSWVSFIIAFSVLLAGAALNDQHNEEESFLSTYCYVVKTGVFAGGAVLSLVTVTLGIIYYIIASAVKSSAAWMHENQGVAMTQPQSVPINAQPVFVPENIYTQYYENPQYYDGSGQHTRPEAHRQNSTWR
ncbi:hypothetical protein KI387_035205 [Taxus chinensis]|uniref:Uncharacterized protein n=1 Tax=Taxus chinensis TaxID=29808 RepID=A0AA38KNS1_TAXCH|nr:hypothetical protein KI387_035205 [Taxus chinensis]